MGIHKINILGPKRTYFRGARMSLNSMINMHYFIWAQYDICYIMSIWPLTRVVKSCTIPVTGYGIGYG